MDQQRDIQQTALSSKITPMQVNMYACHAHSVVLANKASSCPLRGLFRTPMSHALIPPQTGRVTTGIRALP